MVGIVDSATPCTTRRKPSGGRGSQRKKIELPLPDGSQASRKLSLKSLGIASRNKVIRIRTPNTNDATISAAGGVNSADACKAGVERPPRSKASYNEKVLHKRDAKLPNTTKYQTRLVTQ